ncbi:MAG: DUF3048 domain-containing protein [Eubacterium sp.]
MSDKELEEILNEFSTNRDKSDKPDQAPFSQTPLEAPKRREEKSDNMAVLNDVVKQADKKAKKKSNKNIIIIVVALVLAIAVCTGAYFIFFHKAPQEEAEPTENKQADVIMLPQEETAKNPLTGEGEYNESAIDKRPVAVVVENEYSTESVRPQWALSEADIVLEGESEFSTRLLLFWADYTDVPEQVGPARSARPPFIRFSQLFDSIFIHAGMSKTKGNYIGANTVFVNENIDHVNLLASEGYNYFARDNSRQTAVEHTGYLKGDLLPELIEKKGFRTELNKDKFSVLSFNSEATALSQTPAKKVEFKWTNGGNCPKKGTYFYDEETKTYKTTDFDSAYGESNVSWKNLIFLLDTTEYVVKENYKHGKSETYCNYKLTGGKGAVLSEGTYVDITWGVANGRLWMKDADGNEVKLNPGKSYIGYGSQNYNGSITVVE